MNRKTDNFRVMKTYGGNAAIVTSTGGFLSAEEIAEQLATTRNKALLELEREGMSVESIQTMDFETLTTMQGLLGHGYTFGRWETPAKWVPTRAPITRNVGLRDRIVRYLDDQQKERVLEADQAIARARETAKSEMTKLLPDASSRIQRIMDRAVLTFTRYLLLCRIGPVGRGRSRGRSLDPSTISNLTYKTLPPLMAAAVGRMFNDDNIDLSDRCLHLVRHEDLTRFSKYQRTYLGYEFDRMHMLASKGLWSDVPGLEGRSRGATDPSIPGVSPEPNNETDPHRPLPDAYTSTMGQKSLYIIQELGPSLLKLAGQIPAIWERTDDLSVRPMAISGRRAQELVNHMQDYRWLDSKGIAIHSLPFDIRMGEFDYRKRTAALNDDATGTGDGERAVKSSIPWPPQSYMSFMSLCAALQRAHLFVVGMSEGPRTGEVATMQRDCIVRGSDGMAYMRGRTFKTEDLHEGKLRDWVLPDITVQAIEQQSELIRLLEAIGPHVPIRTPKGVPVPLPEPGTHLWGQVGCSKHSKPYLPLKNPNDALKGYVEMLDMDAAPAGQSFRWHRLRKTVARLGALALTESAKILMDVFGHKNIAMTLYYIQTDPDLQSDMRKIARELTVMRGVEVIETYLAAEEAHDAWLRASTNAGITFDPTPWLSNGGFGGGAAPRFAHDLKVQGQRLHKQVRDWNAETIQEAAERMVAMGMAFDYPKPDVLCIKKHTQAGACTHKIGKRDVSNCQASCDYHLALPRLRDDVDGSIRDCLLHYKESVAKGDDWMDEFWANQILTHLGTFDDLRDKWMQDPVICDLVDKANANGISE